MECSWTMTSSARITMQFYGTVDMGDADSLSLFQCRAQGCVFDDVRTMVQGQEPMQIYGTNEIVDTFTNEAVYQLHSDPTPIMYVVFSSRSSSAVRYGFQARWWASAATDTCAHCGAGNYNQITTPSVSWCLCPSGRISTTGLVADCQCKDGFANSNSATANVESCDACAAGKFSAMTNEGLSWCAQCPVGKVSEAASSCVSCEAGKYSLAPLQQECAICPRFSSSPIGSGTLTDCQCMTGFTGANGGQCVADSCQAGKYLYDGQCVHCVQGKFSTQAGAVSDVCVSCGADKTSPAGSDAQTDCVCVAGMYMHAPQVCSACPTNLNSPSGSDDINDCICSRGVTTQSGICQLCPAGTYKGSQSTCVSCARGMYSASIGATSSAACQWCPMGSDSPIASDALTDCTCQMGWEGPDGQPCVSCSPGTYKALSGSATLCVMCPSNTWSSTLGASSLDSCQACPDGEISPQGSNNAMACVPSCPPGQHSTSGRTCLDCLSGQYQPEEGQFTCLACPDATTSDIGATSCVCLPLHYFVPCDSGQCCQRYWETHGWTEERCLVSTQKCQSAFPSTLQFITWATPRRCAGNTGTTCTRALRWPLHQCW